jgi:signal peptide peptidase SppA
MSNVELFDDESAVGEFKSLMSDPSARQAFVELKAQAAESGARTRYQHILRLVSETPWAIRPNVLGVIIDVLTFRVAGGHFSAEEIASRVGARRTQTQGPQGVAVIALHGVIMPKAGGIREMSGGTSVESFRNDFRAALASPDVGGIVIDVDSPGGMVDGVPEMAAEIRAARGAKPIVAVANTEAASAAYWLASQADQLVATKSSRVGSIGVVSAHEDESAKNAAEGVKTTLVSAGQFKTEGNPFEPLSEDARAHLQSMVDEFYGMFVSDVAKGRKTQVDAVRQGFGQGRLVTATDALDTGMIDQITTIDSVIGDMLVGINERRSAAAMAAYLGSSGSVTLPNVTPIAAEAVDTPASDGDTSQIDPEDSASAAETEDTDVEIALLRGDPTPQAFE